MRTQKPNPDNPIDDPAITSYSYERWRTRFLNLILRGALIVGPVNVIVSSASVGPVLQAVYIGALVILAIITFARLSYRFKAGVMLTLIYGLAVSGLFETGAYGDSRTFLLAFIVTSTLLFDWRMGLSSGVLSLLTFTGVGWLVLTGRVTLISQTVRTGSVETWVTAYLTIVLLASVISLGITLLQHEFFSAQKREKKVTEALIQERNSLEGQVQNRTTQLRASADVGRVAASNLDPAQLMRDVVQLVTDRFGHYYVAVFLIEQTGRNAVLREATGEAGRILKERGHQLEVGGQSMVGYAAAQHKARLASNVGEDAVYFSNPLLPDTRSEIALPLIVGDRVLGVLDVQSKQVNAFDEASATLLQSMADQIAVALNNANQYQREQTHGQQSAALLEAALELGGLTDRTQLQDLIVKLTVRLLNAAGAGLWLPIGNDQLELKSTSNRDLIGNVGRRLKVGEGLVGHVYANHSTLRLDNYLAWGDRADAPSDTDMRAALAVPLITHGQVTGILLAARSQSGHVFLAEDENTARLLAAQSASALQIVSLLEQQQQTLQDLNEANRRLTGEAWTRYKQDLVAGFKRQAYIALGYAPVSEAAPLPEIDLAMSARQAVVWSRPTDQPFDVPHATALAAPIMLRGEVLGALQVGDEDSNRTWTAEDERFIQAIADQVALALDNARLIEQTEQRAWRESVISEISRRMFAANDLQGVLQAAGEELGRALKVARAEVAIGSEFIKPDPFDEGNGQVEAKA
jgi:GAF domain-containing protein